MNKDEHKKEYVVSMSKKCRAGVVIGFERTSSAPPPIEESKLHKNAAPYVPKKALPHQHDGLSTIDEETEKKNVHASAAAAAGKATLNASAPGFVPHIHHPHQPAPGAVPTVPAGPRPPTNPEPHATAAPAVTSTFPTATHVSVPPVVPTFPRGTAALPYNPRGYQHPSMAPSPYNMPMGGAPSMYPPPSMMQQPSYGTYQQNYQYQQQPYYARPPYTPPYPSYYPQPQYPYQGGYQQPMPGYPEVSIPPAGSMPMPLPSLPRPTAPVETPILPPKVGSVINTNVVVPATAAPAEGEKKHEHPHTHGEEIAERIAAKAHKKEADSKVKKPEAKREVKPHPKPEHKKEAKAPVGTKEKPKEEPKKELHEHKKEAKPEVAAYEVKKEPQPAAAIKPVVESKKEPIVAPVLEKKPTVVPVAAAAEKKEESELEKLKALFKKYSVPMEEPGKKVAKVFSYDLIMEIKDFKVCSKPPSLLIVDVLTRKKEMREVAIAKRGQKSSYTTQREHVVPTISPVNRRAETAEEKDMKSKAKETLDMISTREKNSTDANEIKLLLNKLTPDNYDKIIESIAKMPAKSEETSKLLVEVIFKKAWSEQKYISLYGKLCKEMIYRELRVPLDKKMTSKQLKDSKFRTSIIAMCELTFHTRKALKESIQQPADPAKKLSPEDIEEIKFWQRKKLFGSKRERG